MEERESSEFVKNGGEYVGFYRGVSSGRGVMKRAAARGFKE